MKNDDNKLVSVGIITYNSAKYVLEALESAKAQSYPYIELIISDDCSTDDTIQICKEWVSKNKERFIRTKIIVPPYNTGTSANCNRLYKACNGEWIKCIAADDKLMPDCVEKFMNFVEEHPDSDIVFGNVKVFGELKSKKEWVFSCPKLFFKELTPRQILLNLFEQNFFPAAARFDKKSCWEEIGRFNENIPLIEDWPFMIKLFAAKKNVLYLDEDVSCYRISDDSVSKPYKHFTVSKRYKESENRAMAFAREMLKKDSFGAWFYATSTLEMGNNWIKKYLFHPLNIFNPFRKEYLSAINKFNDIIQRS